METETVEATVAAETTPAVEPDKAAEASEKPSPASIMYGKPKPAVDADVKSDENAAENTAENTAVSAEAVAQPPADAKTDIQADKQADADVKPPVEIKLVMPDKSLLDPSAIERISAEAKAKGLSSEAAQELLNREHETVAAYNKAQTEQVGRVSDKWYKECESDPVMGGKNLPKTVEYATRAINRFGTKALKETLNRTGFGNYPELVRLLSEVGRADANDKFEIGDTGKKPIVKTPAQRMYGTQ